MRPTGLERWPDRQSRAGVRSPSARHRRVRCRQWLLRDEEGIDAADALQTEHNSGRLALAAPQQIDVEVTAAIRRAVLSGRVEAGEAKLLIRRWLEEHSPSLQLVANSRVLAGAFDFSLQFGVTLFDALYLTLAEQSGLDVVLADERLLRSPAGKLPFVRAFNMWSAEVSGRPPEPGGAEG